MIDLHSHYLPAIDDGAKSFDDSVRMLRMAAADGISTVVVTPHMFIDTFKQNTSARIQAHYDTFIAALKERSQAERPDPHADRELLPKVLLGSENFVNERFILEMEKGIPILTLGQTAYVLLEFPLFGTFQYFDRLLSALFARGLSPIFAHPERNYQFQQDPQILHRLVSQGVYLQLDSMSLTGNFGEESKTMAFYLLKHKLVHVVASDAHGATHRKPLLSQARAIVVRMMGEEKAGILVCDNPARILQGLEVIPLEDPVEEKPPRRSWIAGLFGRA